MTDFASIAPADLAPGTLASRPAPAVARSLRRHARRTPLLVLAAFAALGFALGALDRPAALPEPSLALLLRFMAVLKGAGALGAALLLVWRRRAASAVPGGLGLAYGGGLALMALAPGLIWSLGPVAAGAVAFHVGLVLYAVTALRDDGGPASALPAALRRRG